MMGWCSTLDELGKKQTSATRGGGGGGAGCVFLGGGRQERQDAARIVGRCGTLKRPLSWIAGATRGARVKGTVCLYVHGRQRRIRLCDLEGTGRAFDAGIRATSGIAAA